ncbi:ATP-binding protein, partial [Xanthomonas sp. D-99]|uniref:ATP-binding protein n=1 Tax=Xanthomonas sp. D-99 TaxID=2821273 RepID=UPI001ADAD593
MKLDLAIAPSLAQLAGANDALEQSLTLEGLHAERIGQVRLIVEELGCNALTHGQCAAQPLRLQLQLDAQALVLEMHDAGSAFDPCAAPMPEVTDGNPPTF